MIAAGIFTDQSCFVSFLIMECYHYFTGYTTILITNNVIVGNNITIITDQYTATRSSLLRDHLWTKIKELIKQIINSTAVSVTTGKLVTNFLSCYFCFNMNNSLDRSTCGLSKIYVSRSIRYITIKNPA